VIYYRSPSTFSEYMRQSIRIKMSQGELNEYFTKDILDYKIPKIIILVTFVQSLLAHPLFFCGYMGLFIISKVIPMKQEVSSWEPVASTKKILASA
jgi:hypothetical protein